MSHERHHFLTFPCAPCHETFKPTLAKRVTHTKNCDCPSLLRTAFSQTRKPQRGKSNSNRWFQPSLKLINLRTVCFPSFLSDHFFSGLKPPPKQNTNTKKNASGTKSPTFTVHRWPVFRLARPIAQHQELTDFQYGSMVGEKPGTRLAEQAGRSLDWSR